ncbi:MAG: universal stress protein [Dehalococcoidales bacterium]|nr:universal stress protein [Dehalococcoidales bacterium]
MYSKILVPLDGSKLAESVLPHVETLAKGCNVNEVILLRVCVPPSILSDYPENMPRSWTENVSKMTGHMANQCSLYLGDIEKKLKAAGINVRTESRLGSPANEIVDFADKNGIDLIIMASHGRSGPSRWAYGSTADKVLRSTCVPVMVVKGPGCAPGL